MESQALPSVGYGAASDSYTTPYAPDYPPTQSDDRIVIKNSTISMVVKDVPGVQNQIITYTESIGGYMVSSSLSRPTETPYATIVVRIPSDKLDSSITTFKALGIKVTSETLTGKDVTDQYTDITEHIAILTKTKLQYEAIRDKATEIQDLLDVTRELTNIQKQIDGNIGQQQYLIQNAALSKVTLYLASDETVLPFTPDNAFRPSVIFRYATRSLFTTIYGLGEKLIWISVYAVLWVPALSIVGIIWYRRTHKKQIPQQEY